MSVISLIAPQLYFINCLLRFSSVILIGLTRSLIKSTSSLLHSFLRFDLIILSNIPAFLNRMYKSNYLKNLKELIEKVKFPQTKVVVSYLYSTLLECGSSNDDIYNDEKLREFFSYDDYEYIQFESSDTLASNSGLKKIFPKFDNIFVSK